jgi:hypothetical protein
MAPISGQGALEVSFPALKFSSGAPLIIESVEWVKPEWRWGIVGVIVGNLGYEAIPRKSSLC